MKIMGQLTIIAAIGLAGTILASVLPIPFPGSIMSLLLLFVLMVARIIKPRHVKDVSNFFLSHMGAFFIVPMVDIIDQFGLLGSATMMKFLLVCVLSTIVTFLATAAAVKLTLLITNSLRSKKEAVR